MRAKSILFLVFFVILLTIVMPAKVTYADNTPVGDNACTVTILDPIYFDFDRAILTPKGKKTADVIVAELKKHTNETILLEGHTCDLGTEEYNLALGQRRANAVKLYLIECGISENRINTISYGETKPARQNTSEKNRTFNRHVDYRFTTNKD